MVGSFEDLGQHLHPPGVNLSHPLRNFVRKLMPAEVTVQERGLETAVSGKRGDLPDIPVGARGIGETEMLRSGVSLPAVMKLLGHSSPDMTTL